MRAHAPRRHGVLLAAALACLAAAGAGTLACGKGVAQQLEGPVPDSASRARDARSALAEARRLRQQGRFEAAQRTTERALASAPDDEALHRLQATLLEELGRADEGTWHRRRAAELAPTVPLPDEPLAGAAPGGLVVLLPPPGAERVRGRAPALWPGGPEHTALRERLALRLPGAPIVEAPPQSGASLASVRAWLAEQAPHWAVSLQLERAWCGESIKDGRFSVVWMRAALASPTPAGDRAHTAAPAGEDVIRVREAASDPPSGPECAATAIARALEQWLALETTRALLAQPASAAGASFDRSAIHRMFPELDRRIELSLEEGRRWLAVGSPADARLAFERAKRIDPEDLDTRSFLAELDASEEIDRQLARRRGSSPELHPVRWLEQEESLSSAGLEFLEEQLRVEERRRQDLLAALAMLADDRSATDPQTLAALRPSEIVDPDAPGPALARSLLADTPGPAPVSASGTGSRTTRQPARAQPEFEVRVLHDPRGELVARYYFAKGSGAPLLVEEDSRGDGAMDRWVAYREGRRHEVWEAAAGGGPSDLHLVYDDDGEALVRIELDGDGDGRMDRVFVYESGRLAAERRDTSGDGRFDDVQHYDSEGLIRLREEDVDSDGRVDVRTAYSRGRIVRREIMSADSSVRIQ